MSEKKVPLRSEVKPEECWDLTKIFPSDAAFEQALASLDEASVEKLCAYKGHLCESAETLFSFLKEREALWHKASLVMMYAHLAHDVDVADSNRSGAYSRVMQRLSQLEAALSFVDPELMQLDEAKLEAWYREKEELALYRHYFKVLLREKEHILSEQEEYILAKLSPLSYKPAEVAARLRDADLSFPAVTDAEGREHALSEGLYSLYMQNKDRVLREHAYRNTMGSYHKFRNTLAESYAGQVKADNLHAELRKFSEAREAALFGTQIPVQVYDMLIEEVRANLPLLHDYVAYRKKSLGLDELHYYDLGLPLVEEMDEVHFTFEEAKEIVFEALKPLGEEYRRMLQKAFDERWIDVPENKGKRSGAYSSGVQGTPAYILLNWNGTLNSVYTLIHELGHSMHSWHTWTTQPQVYASYGIFLAEIASTFNENLLTHYLLERYKDDAKMRRYLLTNYLDGVKGTVFRQTMFAEFELRTHRDEQNNIPLTADYLDEIYGELNRAYHGEALTPDPEMNYEWARIPHFYYNFYVYQYATGFSAATAFADMVLSGQEGATERYLNFLKAGRSLSPIELLRASGVDMTERGPVRETLKSFGRYLEELKKLG